MNPEYIIEQFYDTISRRTNFKLKYGGYVMIIPQNPHGLHIQMAMDRLRTAYENRGFYIPPVQITKDKGV
jgi:hypothetical protein